MQADWIESDVARCEVDQHSLIQVAEVELVVHVFTAIHRRILVRAVEAADRYIVVGLNEKRDRSSHRLDV